MATSSSRAECCRYSTASTSATGWPSTTTWVRRSLPGLSSTGFIRAAGSTPAAAACIAWARPISAPSDVTNELRDMFWALNGATETPCRRSHRHSPAAIMLFPASELVPATSIAPFTAPPPPGQHPSPASPSPSPGVVIWPPATPLWCGGAGIRRAGTADVRPDRLDREPALTRLQDLQQLLMAVPPGRREITGQRPLLHQVQDELRTQGLPGPASPLMMGGAEDRVVELDVQRGDRLPGQGPRQLIELSQDLRHHVEVLVRRLRAQPFGGEFLQYRPQAVDLGDLAARQGRDRRTAVAIDDHQAFLAQP